MRNLIFICVTISLFSCNREVDDVREMTPSEQKFIIDNSKDTVLHCKEGTVLRFPANSLIQGTMSKSVLEILVTECYRIEEMLSNNLTTITEDNKILSSGGMVKIEVVANGVKLDSINGIYEIHFNKEFNQGRLMFPFIGHADSTKGNAVIWRLADQDDVRLDGERKYKVYNLYEGYDSVVVDYDVQGYFFRAKTLGWINADYFVEDIERVDFRITLEEFSKPLVILIYKDINSIVGQTLRKDSFEFLELPRGRTPILFIYDIIDEKPHFFIDSVFSYEPRVIKLSSKRNTEIDKILSDYLR